MVQTDYINSSGLSYCGTEAQNIFSKDIYSLDLRNVGVTFIDGVKGKRKIYMGSWDNAWQAYTCPFTPDGGVVLSEAYIEPVAIKVNKEFCRNEFWDSFLVEQTEISLKGGIPQTFAEWYFDKLRKQMNKEYQEIFWQGDTARTATTKAYLKVTDGVEVKLTASGSAANEVTGASSFTVDNILGQVEAVISAGLADAANNEYSTENFKVLMAKADVDLLRMALGKVCCPNNQSIFSNYAQGANGGIIIFGYEVIPTEQSRNLIIFGDPRNLVLGFDTYDSHLQYKIIDMKDTTLDDAYRVGAISNIAVGVIYPETFTYTKA